MAIGSKIGDLYFDVSADVAKAARGIPAAGTAIGKSLVGGISGAISRSVGVITAPIVSGFETAAATGAAVFAATLTTGFTRLRAIDDAQGKLKALGHSTQETATIMDNALQAVLGTQYNLGEAATVAASAVAAGIKPGKELTDYLVLIADTAAVAGISMQDAGGIINKTTAFQRVYLREINQLAQRGIPVFSWLQKEYGVTGEKLREMVSAGEVDAATFQRVIHENIGGAAVEFGMATFTGGLKNTFAAMGRLGEQLLGPFFFALRDFGFPAAIEFFDALTAVITPRMQALAESEGFQRITDFLQHLPSYAAPAVSALEGLGPALGPLIGLFGAKGFGQLKNLLGPFGSFIPQVSSFAGIIIGLVASSPELRSAIGELLQAIGELLGAFTPLLAPFNELLTMFTGDLLTPAVLALADGISWLADQADKLVGPLSSVAGVVREFIEGFRGGFGENAKKDIGGVAEAAATAGEKLRVFVDWVISQLPTVQAVAVTVFNAVRDAMKRVVNFAIDAWPTVQKVIETVAEAVVTAFNWIVKTGVPALVKAFTAVVEFIKANWPTVQSVVRTVIDGIAAAFTWFTVNILPHLIEGFQAVWSFIQRVWPDIVAIVTGALQAIGIVVGIAITAIVYLWENFGQNIINAVQTAWGLVSGLIEAALMVIRGILDVFVGLFTGDWGRMWEGIKGIVSGVWLAIVTVIQYGINTARDIIMLVLAAISEAWGRAWAAIQLVASLAWEYIRSIVQLGIDAVQVAISTVMGVIQSVWDTAWNGIETAVTTVWDTIKSVVQTAIDAVSLSISTVTSAIKTAWDTFWNGLKDTLSTIWDTIKEIVQTGADAVAGFFDVIVRAAEAAAAPILAVADALAAVKRFLGGDVSTVFGGGTASDLADRWLAGQGGNRPTSGAFSTGGIVPGNFSTAVPIMAHGSEMVLNPSQQRRMFDMLNGSSGAGFNGKIEISIDARGATADAAAAIGQAAEDGVLSALAQYTKARGQ